MTRHPYMTTKDGDCDGCGSADGSGLGWGRGDGDGEVRGWGTGLGSADGSGWGRGTGYGNSKRWLDNSDPRYTMGWFTKIGQANIYKTVP